MTPKEELQKFAEDYIVKERQERLATIQHIAGKDLVETEEMRALDPEFDRLFRACQDTSIQRLQDYLALAEYFERRRK